MRSEALDHLLVFARLGCNHLANIVANEMGTVALERLVWVGKAR